MTHLPRRSALIGFLVLAAFLSGSQRLSLAEEDLTSRLKAAGFRSVPDGTLIWSQKDVAVHLVPGIPLRRAACVEVQVRTLKESTPAQLDSATPYMITLAVETLRGPEAALAFEFAVQGSSTKPAALRDALIRWAETARWPTIGADSKPEALPGFEGWLVVGVRTFKPATRLVVGVARPV